MPPTPLDSQAKNNLVQEIVALDWSGDFIHVASLIVQKQLGVNAEQAMGMLMFLQREGLIVCVPERMANVDEPNPQIPLKAKWIEPEEGDKYIAAMVANSSI